MKKFLPYEAKGKFIREMKLTSLEEAVRANEMFKCETDKWLKKLIVIRLLEFDKLELLNLSKDDLLNFTKWQIDL